MFGDDTPEDAWDPDDPVPELVANLIRRLAAILKLKATDDIIAARLTWLSNDLEHVLDRINRGMIGRPPGH